MAGLNLPSISKLVIGGRYGDTKRKINPADIFQTLRQNYKGKVRAREVGIGAWKGETEPSYSYRLKGFSGENRENVRRGLRQESLYTEDKTGFSLFGADWSSHAKHKVVIYISGKIDSDFLAQEISGEARKTRLFSGGSVYYEPRAKRMRIESAIFEGDPKQIRGEVSKAVSGIHALGFRTSVRIVKVK